MTHVTTKPHHHFGKVAKDKSLQKHHMTPNYNSNCILPMAKGDFFIHCLGQISIWVDVTTTICYCLYD